jgi:hypothetical protein
MKAQQVLRRWPGIWFLALALLVLGPLLGHGFLLLLDAPTGPRPSWPAFFPLPSQGLFSAGAPVSALAQFAVTCLTIPAPELTNKGLVVLIIVVGGLGMFRLASEQLRVGAVPATVAGTLFVVNPFVYERLISGQLYLMCAYAFLP